MAGFVYVMSNPAFPDLLKIGKSDRDPKTYRKQELETTGVPESFKVEYYAFVNDPSYVERTVHSDLSEYRNKANREFFRCSVPKVINSIRTRANGQINYEDMDYESPEDIEYERRRKESQDRKKREEEQRRIRDYQLKQEKEAQEKERARNEKSKYSGWYIFGYIFFAFLGVFTQIYLFSIISLVLFAIWFFYKIDSGGSQYDFSLPKPNLVSKDRVYEKIGEIDNSKDQREKSVGQKYNNKNRQESRRENLNHSGVASLRCKECAYSFITGYFDSSLRTSEEIICSRCKNILYKENDHFDDY